VATDIAITLSRPTVSAATGFTVTMLRGYITSGLSDSVLQTYLDAAMDAIDDVLGPSTVKDRITTRGELLMLTREAESITSVVEDARDSAVTLAADDYELSDSGYLLYRLRSGTHPRAYWSGRIDVTYVRSDDWPERIRVAVALVNLELTQAPGLASQTIGTWSETYRTDTEYAEQREALLSSLSSTAGLF
jgi:hypothetical protein